MPQYLAELTSEAFEEHRASLLAELRERPQSMDDAFAEMRGELLDSDRHWDRAAREIAAAKMVTKKDVEQMLADHVVTGGHAWSRLSVLIDPGSGVMATNPESVLQGGQGVDSDRGESTKIRRR